MNEDSIGSSLGKRGGLAADLEGEIDHLCDGNGDAIKKSGGAIKKLDWKGQRGGSEFACRGVSREIQFCPRQLALEDCLVAASTEGGVLWRYSRQGRFAGDVNKGVRSDSKEGALGSASSLMLVDGVINGEREVEDTGCSKLEALISKGLEMKDVGIGCMGAGDVAKGGRLMATGGVAEEVATGRREEMIPAVGRR